MGGSIALSTTTGRANQKRRTHDAIVRATTELMRAGREVTMPEVAKVALVSEARSDKPAGETVRRHTDHRHSSQIETPATRDAGLALAHHPAYHFEQFRNYLQ